MRYIIGFDIGIASVGWCIMECEEHGKVIRMMDMGSRVFEPAETPKEGKPLAEERRMARGTRRRLRRQEERLRRTKKLFEMYGVTIDFHGEDVNLLRVNGLDKKLTENDFARVLYSLCKRRGFRSNRKSERSDEKTGKLLNAANANAARMKENNYRTLGEMLLKNYSFEKVNAAGKVYRYYDMHNHGEEYTKTVYRDALEEEIDILFECQKKFGNKLATDEIKEKFLGVKQTLSSGKNVYTDGATHRIFGSQRNYDDGPGQGSPYMAEYKVGNCIFEKELRAPKGCYSVEYCVALQKINNIRLNFSDGTVRELTEEERKTVIDLTRSQKEVSYGSVRSKLKISQNAFFNLSYPKAKNNEKPEEVIKKFEKKEIVSTRKTSSAIQDCLSEQNKNSVSLLDEIAVILSKKKTDDQRKALFATSEPCRVLSEEEIEKLLAVDTKGYSNLGLTATKKIIPFLEQGYKYSEACEKAGYQHSNIPGVKHKYLTVPSVRRKVEEITSPVVRRSIYQTLLLLNGIIGRYGSPFAVNIELARDISRSHDERETMKNEMQKRREENDRYRKTFFDKFSFAPKKIDIIKYRLYEEQRGKCLYSGEPIPDTGLIFNGNYYQVDHILPYSRSFNDSMNNMALVKTEENQRKGNHTPYEYMSEEKFNAFSQRVGDLYANNPKKRMNLLKKNFGEDAEKEFKSRALNDTRYASRFLSELIGTHLKFDECAPGKKHVFIYNGQMTAVVRRNWGIQKIREDGDFHHAVDAAVIANMTESMRLRIEKWFKYKEDIRYADLMNSDGQIIDKDTGEIYGKSFPLPYDTFTKEIQYRSEIGLSAQDRALYLMGIGYTEERAKAVRGPVVSRMQKEKVTGSLHGDTVYGFNPSKNGEVLTKTKLTKLKLKNGEIEGYYNEKSDNILYNALKTRLIDSGWCSQLHKRTISGYDESFVNVEYDDCNPFGMIAGDFGEITSLPKHATKTASNSTIIAFNSLSELFAGFIRNFEIPTDGTEYIPSIGSDALDDYTLFYNKAIELYDSSLVSFAKGISNDLSHSAVIGINQPYTMSFGSDVSPELINFQTVIARLFGFSSTTDFTNYAQKLADIYAQYRTNITNSATTNEALENGCFYTENGSFVFPIAVKNELSSAVLTYVIIDTSGHMSVWVNDITAALWATNFNSFYHTNSIINNKLFCKNLLFVTGYVVDAKKAFAEPFYKPKADGTPGNIVRSVKTVGKMSGLPIRGGLVSNGGMVRVDVFSKGGKYYCVPIYLRDVYSGVLPNRAATAGKESQEWPVMDEGYTFEFSMTQNTLLYLESEKGITMSKKNISDETDNIPEIIIIKRGYVYFDCFDRDNGSIKIKDLSGCYKKKGLGLKTIPLVKKCTIDIFGNIAFAPKEERKGLR